MGAAAAAIVAATTAHLLWVVVVVVAAAAVNCVYSLAAAGYCRGRGMYQYWISSYHWHRAHYYYPGRNIGTGRGYCCCCCCNHIICSD